MNRSVECITFLPNSVWTIFCAIAKWIETFYIQWKNENISMSQQNSMFVPYFNWSCIREKSTVFLFYHNLFLSLISTTLYINYINFTIHTSKSNILMYNRNLYFVKWVCYLYGTGVVMKNCRLFFNMLHCCLGTFTRSKKYQM